jgi:hypothetical protein
VNRNFSAHIDLHTSLKTRSDSEPPGTELRRKH